MVEYVNLDVFKDALEQLTDSHRTGPALLDLRQVKNICSTGLGLIVVAYLRFQRDGQELAIVCGPGHLGRVLQSTRLNERIRVFPSEEEAAAALPLREAGSPGAAQ